MNCFVPLDDETKYKYFLKLLIFQWLSRILSRRYGCWQPSRWRRQPLRQKWRRLRWEIPVRCELQVQPRWRVLPIQQLLSLARDLGATKFSWRLLVGQPIINSILYVYAVCSFVMIIMNLLKINKWSWNVIIFFLQMKINIKLVYRRTRTSALSCVSPRAARSIFHRRTCTIRHHHLEDWFCSQIGQCPRCCGLIVLPRICPMLGCSNCWPTSDLKQKNTILALISFYWPLNWISVLMQNIG